MLQGTSLAPPSIPNEPQASALFFVVVALLLAASALLSQATQRLRVPAGLIFLAIGMLAGSEGIGGIEFDDYRFAFRAGSAALALILFDGGLNTPVDSLRRALAPAGLLATVGVAGTMCGVAVVAHLLGLPWSSSFLLGAVVSSTDAAAVFAVLRSSGIQLKHRVGGTLEVESGMNDPVAVILMTLLTQQLLGGEPISIGHVVFEVLREIVIGAACGVAIGGGARWLLARTRLPASGLYSVMTLATALFAFSLPTLIGGSGFLSVYVAAVALGAGRLPYGTGLRRIHDALAWLGQVAMFLMLGLLVYPSRLIDAAWVGTIVGLALTFVARPVMVAMCLAPLRFPRNDILYIGWVGLRGAVPIVLATFPVLAGAPGAARIFDVVFFIVALNAVLPGMTVSWMTRRLELESQEPPPPAAVLTVESFNRLDGELLSYYIDEALPVAGMSLEELPFPDGAAVTMIVRGRELIAPKGDTRLEVGDHAYVLTRPDAVGMVQLLFGRPESS
ncbi:MAG TPA: potassium/proton antiporter [Gemmatimonadaceae bacterium]|nr:potassium/proton antiporter [Gemmatimonadaceae bacterium]